MLTFFLTFLTFFFILTNFKLVTSILFFRYLGKKTEMRHDLSLNNTQKCDNKKEVGECVGAFVGITQKYSESLTFPHTIG